MSKLAGCATFQFSCPDGSKGFTYDSLVTNPQQCRSKKGIPLYYDNATKLCAKNGKMFAQASPDSTTYNCCSVSKGTGTCSGGLVQDSNRDWVWQSCFKSGSVAPWSCTSKTPCWGSGAKATAKINTTEDGCRQWNPRKDVASGEYMGLC